MILEIPPPTNRKTSHMSITIVLSTHTFKKISVLLGLLLGIPTEIPPNNSYFVGNPSEIRFAMYSDILLDNYPESPSGIPSKISP